MLLLEQLRNLVGNHFSSGVGKFKPCIMRFPQLDQIQYLNEDRPMYEDQIEGSNFALMRDLHTNKVIGIQISEISAYR